MPRGQSLTNLETAEIMQASCAFGSNTRINAVIWGNVQCCVCFQCRQHCIIRINPTLLCYHPSTCGPSNQSPTSEWEGTAASFLELFYRLFFAVLPKLECRVSRSMVHIHPGAEWQEAGHQLPSQTACKGFFYRWQLQHWKREARVNGKQVCLSGLQQERTMYLVMCTSRYIWIRCAIAASDSDNQLKMELSWTSRSAVVHSPRRYDLRNCVCKINRE